jgi:hypothetical protein
VLAYLAFHPAADAPVAEYVVNGSLNSDSGTKVLVLFTTSTATLLAPNPTPAVSVPGVSIQSGIHPSYEMVRMLFDPRPSPPLPAIVLFKSFVPEAEAVCLSLSGLDSSAKVTERLRMAFAIATEAASKPDDKFANVVSVAFQKQRFPYDRTGRKSLREWFVRGYQLTYDHRGDIEALIPLI